KLLRIPNLKVLDGLSRRHPELYQEMLIIEAGKQSIASVRIDRSMLKILLTATVFEIDGRTYKVIAIQNVQEALDETESKAWQKLLSVLTHEIMNSVAPISSVAKTLNDLMLENESGGNDHLPVEDIRTGLETIERRSEGLLRFSETYRNLSKITSLNIQTVTIRDLFDGLLLLMQPSMHQKKISLQTQLEADDLELNADANLVEQVLINLMMNAIEAVKDRPESKIQLTAKHGSLEKIQISVSDNGTGIAPELMDNIFIPFFSTRKNGTGIGLSLCKQIMLLHKGNIQVKSIEGAGSTFILQFP
nr:HAMP domain-containing histidine kinase [Chitinophagaceae bacterium]